MLERFSDFGDRVDPLAIDPLSNIVGPVGSKARLPRQTLLILALVGVASATGCEASSAQVTPTVILSEITVQSERAKDTVENELLGVADKYPSGWEMPSSIMEQDPISGRPKIEVYKEDVTKMAALSYELSGMITGNPLKDPMSHTTILYSNAEIKSFIQNHNLPNDALEGESAFTFQENGLPEVVIRADNLTEKVKELDQTYSIMWLIYKSVRHEYYHVLIEARKFAQEDFLKVNIPGDKIYNFTAAEGVMLLSQISDNGQVVDSYLDRLMEALTEQRQIEDGRIQTSLPVLASSEYIGYGEQVKGLLRKLDDPDPDATFNQWVRYNSDSDPYGLLDNLVSRMPRANDLTIEEKRILGIFLIEATFNGAGEYVDQLISDPALIKPNATAPSLTLEDNIPKPGRRPRVPERLIAVNNWPIRDNSFCLSSFPLPSVPG